MARLEGKRALITGGTTGIGLETARRFLKEGARVAITGKNPATLEAARKELGSEVLVVPSDASEVAAQGSIAEATRRAFGGLDVPFVNAGIAELRPVGQWDEAGFDRAFAINSKGRANTSVYGASKAALLSLTRTLSGELIARGIRVNAVSPGPISTPLYGKLGLSDADLKSVSASIQNQVPAGRFGSAGEIAQAVVYLASDESAYMVGGELMIDAGMGTL
jgi:NAD(P)-dependent dehydrogenase (short-subunit alcohol dehydrogenase family)